jgi:hypothetical protein
MKKNTKHKRFRNSNKQKTRRIKRGRTIKKFGGTGDSSPVILQEIELIGDTQISGPHRRPRVNTLLPSPSPSPSPLTPPQKLRMPNPEESVTDTILQGYRINPTTKDLIMPYPNYSVSENMPTITNL